MNYPLHSEWENLYRPRSESVPFACHVFDIWATTWQNQQNDLCAQRRRISLGTRPVWSKSSLSAWRNIGPLITYWVHSEDSDQTGQMHSCHFVGFVMRRLILKKGANANQFLSSRPIQALVIVQCCYNNSIASDRSGSTRFSMDPLNLFMKC